MMKNPLSRITNPIISSIRNKLIFVFIGIIVIPLALLSYISYERFVGELQRNYIKDNIDTLEQADSRLDDYFSQLDGVTISMRMDGSLRDITEGNDVGWVLHNEKVNTLLNDLYQQKDTKSILFYYPITKELFVANTGFSGSFQNAGDIETKDWYKKLIADSKEFFIQTTHKLEGYKEEYRINSNTEVFSVYRYFSLGFRSRIYGVVAINYGLDTIESICNKLKQDNNEEIVYLDNTGAVFYASNPEDINLLKLNTADSGKKSGYFEFSKGSEKWLAVFARSENSGYTICKMISLNVLYKQASNTKNIDLFLSGIIILVLTVASVLISYRITKPLSILKNSMAKAGDGDLESYVSIYTHDEIGKISSAFNLMLRKINSLVNEKYNMQLLYKTAQLQTLQAQINPHFLYNTLQAIGSAALKAGNKDLYNMTMALSEMFRYSIKSGGDIVSISDEIKNVKNYLFVQKFRYNDRLSYSIDIPEELYPLKIPKLILQPIVENAIIHGIEPSKSNGLITIAFIKDDGCLNISIADNGVGMSGKELSEINAILRSSGQNQACVTEKVGIYNVLQRLKIIFGEKCVMTIESEIKKGTKVSIRLPIN